MIYYEWNDSLSVNNTKIDNEHKELINKAREFSKFMLEGKGNEVLVKTLDFFNFSLGNHFRDEVNLLKVYNYPRIEEYKSDCQFFLKQLQDLTLRIKQNPTLSSNVLELNKFISGWYFKHIMKFTRDFAKFTKEEKNLYYNKKNIIILKCS